MATLQRVRAAERFIYRTKGSSLSLIWYLERRR
jgi:hypothetical protein